MPSGDTPTMASPAPAIPCYPQHSTNPFDGGYDMTNGGGMFVMDGTEETGAGKYDNEGENAFATTTTGSYHTLYNVPSYYQAGTYGGGGNNGANYPAQSSRKLPGGRAPLPLASTDNYRNGSVNEAAPAAPNQLYGSTGMNTTAEGPTVPDSGHGGTSAAYDYNDLGDFYGVGVGAASAGSREGNSCVPWRNRSGATTATSLGDCHLSRKEDGGFTPQTENTFLQSHGSFGARSLESRAGDHSAVSEEGSAYDAAYYGHLASQHESEPGLLLQQQQQQRRLSGSFRKGNMSSSVTSKSASGGSISRLSKSSHTAPSIAPSPAQRSAPPRSPPAQNTTAPKPAAQRKRSSTAAQEAEEGGRQELRKSRSFHSYAETYGAAGCSPLYDIDGRSTGNATPPDTVHETVVVAAAPAVPATPSASPAKPTPLPSPPPKATLNRSRQVKPGRMLTSRKVSLQPISDIPLLPDVPDREPPREPRSPLRRESEASALAPMQKVAAPAKAASNAASPLRAKLKKPVGKGGNEGKRRALGEGSDAASSQSGSSTSQQARTPPSCRPSTDKTTPTSKRQDTVLPLTSATTTSATTLAPPANAMSGKDSARSNAGRGNQAPTTPATTRDAATTTSTLSVNHNKESTRSSPLSVHLAKAVGAPAGAPAILSPQLTAFTASPPPSESRTPGRFFRRRHMSQQVVPLSATEVSKPETSSAQPAPTRTPPTSAGSRGASNIVPTTTPPNHDIHGSSLASNVTPMATNNVGGEKFGGGVGTRRNVNDDGGSKPQLPSPQGRRRPSIAANVAPPFDGAGVTRDRNFSNGRVSRHRSGSDMHSLTDVAGTAQTRSYPSLDLSVDEGTNPYLQRRSSSWSGHSTAASSDSGDRTHHSASRAKRQQDRVLPNIEEMGQFSKSRFGLRL
ncbi:hypothetical protein ABB37_09117 [Leptomonas pyrrhocoris]|uniref:Uncharacterized protein n=1 Tax=Leptomonas pyrrhocoris TaxID=157538 RepID=A0A0M9FRB4_LEPPY|nr:hypothetical protein ABB37_09117 [Leptomonas pyrrhocoris]KPA74417.1 hypothetical protein ABB37_09117 [Leptomonas pyrrhocoris]|eukprot:XP_015652856.1 hypothetical protein ABB37_09117 [Leptomonas pyrrhocoris]